MAEEKKYTCQLRRGVKDDTLGRNDWEVYEAQIGHVKPLEGELVLEYDNGIPRLKLGDGVNEFSALPYMSADSFVLPSPVFVTLYADKWVQATDDRYYQTVSVQNARVTANSKVDLQPGSEQLSIFHEKDLAFVAENSGGTISVFCVGQVPTNDYVVQATVTEVAVAADKIIGDTTATPNPRPDWNQDDPTKANYIENKPDTDNFILRIEELETQVEELWAKITELTMSGSQNTREEV